MSDWIVEEVFRRLDGLVEIAADSIQALWPLAVRKVTVVGLLDLALALGFLLLVFWARNWYRRYGIRYWNDPSLLGGFQREDPFVFLTLLASIGGVVLSSVYAYEALDQLLNRHWYAVDALVTMIKSTM